jgi:hypothetical protein
MAGLPQFHSFIGKFVSLWQQGLDAKPSVNSRAGQAWIQLHVGLGDGHGPQQQEPQGHVCVPTPARLRCREKRAEARRLEAEKTKEDKSVKEASAQEVVLDVAAEKHPPTKFQDEICTDAEYLKKVDVTEKVTETKTCSVDFYPKNLDTIEDFRKDLESFFKKRKDIIKAVIESRVEDFGRRVKLRSVVKIRFAWTSFFNDPARNYSDLPGIGTVRHGCENLSQCDPAPS